MGYKLLAAISFTPADAPFAARTGAIRYLSAASIPTYKYTKNYAKDRVFRPLLLCR